MRFPTSLTGDGTDAMNTDCDYSSAYVTLTTSTDLVGHGMTFTIGRGNDIVCSAIKEVANRLIGKDTEELFANMGATWDYLCSDPQLRWYVCILFIVRLKPDFSLRQDWSGEGCHSHCTRRCQQRVVGYVRSLAKEASMEAYRGYDSSMYFVVYSTLIL